jgi:hypothetical protein
MNSNLTEKRQIRKFGLIAFILFGSLCAFGIWREKLLPTYLFGALSVLGLGFICAPMILKPVFTAWQQIAFLVGRTVTILMLILFYYLMITPSGLIKRLMGGRPLPLNPNKKVSSYWVKKPEPAQAKERFLKRY